MSKCVAIEVACPRLLLLPPAQQVDVVQGPLYTAEFVGAGYRVVHWLISAHRPGERYHPSLVPSALSALFHKLVAGLSPTLPVFLEEPRNKTYLHINIL